MKQAIKWILFIGDLLLGLYSFGDRPFISLHFATYGISWLILNGYINKFRNSISDKKELTIPARKFGEAREREEMEQLNHNPRGIVEKSRLIYAVLVGIGILEL